jgi:hypothetical protein
VSWDRADRRLFVARCVLAVPEQTQIERLKYFMVGGAGGRSRLGFVTFVLAPLDSAKARAALSECVGETAPCGLSAV